MARDKILVVCRDREAVNVTIDSIFKFKVPPEESIVKELAWETKYYSTFVDVYIDELDTDTPLEQWVSEFMGEECAILRDVLAGLVFIGSYDEDTASLKPILQDDNLFAIWCDTNAERKEYNYEDNTLETLEVVSVHDSRDKNDFGEKVGVSRIQEVVDTYPWAHTILKSQRNGPSTDHDMMEIIARLESAKLQYEMNPNEDIAVKLSEELSKLI